MGDNVPPGPSTATSGMVIPNKSTIAEEEIQVPYGRDSRAPRESDIRDSVASDLSADIKLDDTPPPSFPLRKGSGGNNTLAAKAEGSKWDSSPVTPLQGGLSALVAGLGKRNQSPPSDEDDRTDFFETSTVGGRERAGSGESNTARQPAFRGVRLCLGLLDMNADGSRVWIARRRRRCERITSTGSQTCRAKFRRCRMNLTESTRYGSRPHLDSCSWRIGQANRPGTHARTDRRDCFYEKCTSTHSSPEACSRFIRNRATVRLLYETWNAATQTNDLNGIVRSNKGVMHTRKSFASYSKDATSWRGTRGARPLLGYCPFIASKT